MVGIELTFDKPVKMIIPGEGANVPYFGVQLNQPRSIITNQCDSASTPAVNAIPIISSSANNRECFFRSNGGADMTIWTTHFTSYGTISPFIEDDSSGGGSDGWC